MPPTVPNTVKATFKEDKILFAVYFDFECLTLPCSICEPDQSKSSTTKYQNMFLEVFVLSRHLLLNSMKVKLLYLAVRIPNMLLSNSWKSFLGFMLA